ncbi:MAG: helix-turn-helix domain-containing protein [Bacteroidota bacterium]
MFGYAGWYTKDIYFQVLFYLPLQQVFLIGPVLYFYVQSLTNETFNPLRGREWLHLLPAALYLLYSLVIFIGDIVIFEEIYFYEDGQDKDLDLWYQVAGFISMMIYFILSLWIYRKYKKKIYNYLSYAEEVSYDWVRRFLVMFLLLLVLRLLFFIINPEWGEFGRKFWYYLSISFVLYYLSIRGYKHSLQLVAFLFQNESLKNRDAIKLNELSSQSESIASENESNELNDALEWVNKINSLMKEQQLYENPILTLGDIAKILETNTRTISSAINKGTKMNFNDFVNSFRIEAVTQKFDENLQEGMTLLGIALSCGFNSKSTFNRAFKKQKGITPREYLTKMESSSAKS